MRQIATLPQPEALDSMDGEPTQEVLVGFSLATVRNGRLVHTVLTLAALPGAEREDRGLTVKADNTRWPLVQPAPVFLLHMRSGTARGYLPIS